MISLAVGDKGKQGNWWHVLNLIITTLPGRGFKTFEYGVVDRIVPQTCNGVSCGPTVDVAGTLVNTFDPHPKQAQSLEKVSIFALRSIDRTCGQLVAIGVTVRDCVTNSDLASKAAEFAIDWGTPASSKLPISQA